VRNIELFDAYAIHIFATLHDAFPLPRRIDPAAFIEEVGIKAAKVEGERCTWPELPRSGQAGRKRASVIRDQLGRWRRGKGLGTQVRIVDFHWR
jgi:hypothetical protein